MTNSQPVPKQQLQNSKIIDSMKFPKKVELPDKRGFELVKMRRGSCHPGQLPFINWAWHLWHGIFPLGSQPGDAPSQRLHTRSLAEYQELEEVLDFIATTKNISVINVLLVLNPKHSSYWDEN